MLRLRRCTEWPPDPEGEHLAAGLGVVLCIVPQAVGPVADRFDVEDEVLLVGSGGEGERMPLVLGDELGE
jgi:hypothetical protein